MYFEPFPIFQEIATCSGTASLEKQITENLRVKFTNKWALNWVPQVQAVEGQWPVNPDLGLYSCSADH